MKTTPLLLSALALILSYSASTMPSQAGGPAAQYNVTLERAGVAIAFFTDVSGLGSETVVQELVELGPSGQQIVRKLPGRLKWQDISLQRGLTSSVVLRDWRKQVEDGDITNARKDGAIIISDAQGSVVAKWTFTNGWPSKLQNHLIPSTTTEGEKLIEELTIVHEGLVRVL